MQLDPHLYAYDTQIYDNCAAAKVSALQQRMSACTDKVAEWMWVNHLQLNATKTEVLCMVRVATSSKQIARLSIGSDIVMPVRIVHDLDVFIDSDVSMRTGVSKRQWPTT